jgi:two-component sensor histidine kinase/PAS domain-containing protein
MSLSSTASGRETKVASFARAASPRARFRLPAQAALAALVFCVLAPLLAFSAFLVDAYARAERERFARDAEQIARQAALVIDAELRGALALLRGLANSTSLREGDLARFHDEATRLVSGAGEVVVLRELGPRQLLNTERAFGPELPAPPPIPAEDAAALRAGRAVVGGVYRSPLGGEPRVALALPVPAPGGGEPRVLAVTLPTARLRDVLVPAVPAGWVVGVGDRAGTYVTRSLRHEDVSGRPALPEYIALARGPSGSFRAENFEGVRLLAGYRWSDLSGWLIAANIPETEVEAPLARAFRLFWIAGVAALALSLALALVVGRSLAASAGRLAARAAGLGRGERTGPIGSRVAEFAVIDAALTEAADRIDERERALEGRRRELEAVLDTVPAAVSFTYDPEAREVIRNPFGAALYRAPLREKDVALAGRGFRLLSKDRELEHDEVPLRRAARGERVIDEELTVVFDDGTQRTILSNAAPLEDERGRRIGAVAVSLDITERKRVEEQRRVLADELDHRVKNALATVQALASQTARTTNDLSEFRTAFSARLGALAATHDLLRASAWEGVELGRILDAELAPYTTPGDGRVRLAGPRVVVAPALVTPLGMVAHELATNAAKYGALKGAGGALEVAWAMDGDAVVLDWRERAAAPVETPSGTGFGTRLIERIVTRELKGSWSADFAPPGLEVRLRVPLRARD